MAKSANAYGTFSGRPDHRLNLYVYTAQQVGNRSLIAWGLYAERTGGWQGSYNNDSFSFSVNVGGNITNGSAPLPFSSSNWQLQLATGQHWFDHDGNGDLTIGFSAAMPSAGQFGSASTGTAFFSPDRTARPPSAPRNLSVESITPVSAGVRYIGPADFRGSTLIRYRAHWHEINGTTNPAVWIDLNSNGYTNPIGQFQLKPSTTYHVYVFAETNVGNGEVAGVSLTTLPATAPGISVAPAPSGRTARVTMTPPSGVSGVSSYKVEYRLGASGVINTVTSSSVATTISGLAPGTLYQYRAQAVIGSYQSPKSAWISATQPAPSTTPGDYFDGDSPPKQDTSYIWLGTPKKSRSQEVGTSPLGWLTFAEGAAASGGAGVVVRSSGGHSGGSCARVIFTRDTENPGFIAGIGPLGAGVVEAGANYWASIHLQLFAEQRKMQVGIAWYAANLSLISTSWGAATSIQTSQGAWLRMAMMAVAPAGAVKGAPVIRDVSTSYGYGEGPYGEGEYGGAGEFPWAPFRGGDFILLDDAMLTLSTLFPYFDGSTPDTPQYQYDWLGTPNASPSSRTTLDPLDVDLLADPDCPPPPAPPTVPAVPTSCIDEVGTWRRYWVVIPSGEIGEWKQVVPTVSVTTGPFAARQLRVRLFRNPGDLSPDGIDPNSWESEQIVSYVPANTTIVLDGTDERAYATVNGSEPRDAGRLLYGTGGGPPSWPTMSCGDGYALAFDVPLEAPAGNESIGIQLTERV